MFRLALCVTLAALAASAGAEAGRREAIARDLQRLEADLKSAKFVSGSSSTESSAMLSTSASFDPLESHAQGQLSAGIGSLGSSRFSLSSSGSAKHLYYRGVVGGKDVDMILKKQILRPSGETHFTLEVREQSADAAGNNGNGQFQGLSGLISSTSFSPPAHCRVHEESLLCTVRGTTYQLTNISENGLAVLAGSEKTVFWQYRYMLRIDVDKVVSSLAEFVRVYLREAGEALKNGRDPAAVEARFAGALRGLERSLRQYASDFARKNSDASEDDRDTIASLPAAAATQGKAIGEWAKKINGIYDEVRVEPRPFTAENARIPVRDNAALREFSESLNSGGAAPRRRAGDTGERYEFDAKSEGLLRQGTQLGAKSLSNFLVEPHRGQTGVNSRKIEELYNHGLLEDYIEGALYDAVATSPRLARAFSGAVNLPETIEAVIAEKTQAIGNWFTGTSSVAQTNDAVSARIEDGSLAPGEAQIVETLANAKGASDQKAAAEAAEKAKFTATPRFSPTVNYAALAAGITDPMYLLAKADIGLNLSLVKGKNFISLDTNVAIHNPGLIEHASATIDVKVDGGVTTANGATINAGVSGRAVVLGVLKGDAKVEEVVVSSYIRYKKGGLSMGFVGTLFVPMNDAALERTHFKDGNEVHFRADVSYTTDRLTFTAFAEGKVSENFQSVVGIGGRAEYRIEDNFSFFTEFQYNQDTGAGFRDRNAEGKVMAGVMWRF